MKQQGLMSVKELAAFLKCSRTTVFNMVNRGDIRKIKLGKTVRFEVCDVQELIERNKK